MTSALLSEVGRGEVVLRATLPDVPLTPKEVGQRIARAREAKTPKPWSQLDTALALGVSPSTIYRWEKGKLPSMNELIRLAEVLDKPTDYLTEPPERQAELADLQRQLEVLPDRLQSLEDSVVASREAALEILASIHDQLVRIQERLDTGDARASQ